MYEGGEDRFENPVPGASSTETEGSVEWMDTLLGCIPYPLCLTICAPESFGFVDLIKTFKCVSALRLPSRHRPCHDNSPRGCWTVLSIPRQRKGGMYNNHVRASSSSPPLVDIQNLFLSCAAAFMKVLSKKKPE